MNKQIKSTKIIATIGPATDSALILSKLITAGADVFRFNLKHNKLSWHEEVINKARKVAKRSNKKIQFLVDLPTYKFHKGINLAVTQQVEHVALSYIRQAEEIKKFREVVVNAKLSANIITKIETKEALNNFSAILNETDSIMVARGDLGKSIFIEKVPFVQKELISASTKSGKNVVVATEMLLSMTAKNEPTRAEVSDVANAVLEGSSSLMLSEETSIGKYPVEAVEIMKKIIIEAENWQKLGHLEINLANNKKFKFGL